MPRCKIGIAIFVVFLGFLPIICLAQGDPDKLTLTTFYPAPYGVYEVLKLHPISDAEAPTDADCSAVNEGAMYYRESLDQVLLCNGTSWVPLGAGSLWQLKGDDLYLEDTNWNVGIGTDNPAAGYKLDVDGKLKASSISAKKVTVAGCNRTICRNYAITFSKIMTNPAVFCTPTVNLAASGGRGGRQLLGCAVERVTTNPHRQETTVEVALTSHPQKHFSSVNIGGNIDIHIIAIEP
ncbi:MAG: hypothetical protein JSW40_00080 [Candidatus Omnitrophota bacterium]|nr:MAG: hypothetical protein JSW40_00080 [Candidatus Omnitrophota bacterium]